MAEYTSQILPQHAYLAVANDSALAVGIGGNSSDRFLDLIRTISSGTPQPPRGLAMPVVEASVVTLLLMVSLAANFLVFAVFHHKPVLLTTSNKLLTHLSVVQCLMMLVVSPLWTASIFQLSWSQVSHVCPATGVVVQTLFTVATYNVVIVAVDRCMAITRPLHYPRLITAKRMMLCLLAAWVLALAVSLVPSFGVGQFTYHSQLGICVVAWSSSEVSFRVYSWLVIAVCFFLPLSVITVVYGVIYHVAMKASSRNKMRGRSPDLSASDILGVMAPVTRRASSISTTQFLWRRRSSAGTRSVTSLSRDDLMATKTVVMALTAFLLCWLPYYCVHLLDLIRGGAGPLPYWAYFLAMYLVMSGCLINPLIYVFRSTIVKETLCVTGYVTLVCKMCPCRRKARRPPGGDLLYRPLPRAGLVQIGRLSLDAHYASSLPFGRGCLDMRSVISAPQGDDTRSHVSV